MDPLAYKTLFLGLWMALFFVGERLAAAGPLPFSQPAKARARLARNIGLWVILALLSPLIILPLSAWGAGGILWTRPEALGGVFGLFISVIALDLFAYWLHRAYHRLGLLWRLHAPHHFDEHLDATSAVRFHPGEVVVSASLRLAPIILLAIPFTHVAIFEGLLLASAIFHHSNIALPPRLERALSKVFVTPGHHWVHHHATHEDTNSNFAGVFSLWDSLFGTKSATKRVPAMKIGVAGVEDKPFLGLLLSPFIEQPAPREKAVETAGDGRA